MLNNLRNLMLIYILIDFIYAATQLCSHCQDFKEINKEEENCLIKIDRAIELQFKFFYKFEVKYGNFYNLESKDLYFYEYLLHRIHVVILDEFDAQYCYTYKDLYSRISRGLKVVSSCLEILKTEEESMSEEVSKIMEKLKNSEMQFKIITQQLFKNLYLILNIYELKLIQIKKKKCCI